MHPSLGGPDTQCLVQSAQHTHTRSEGRETAVVRPLGLGGGSLSEGNMWAAPLMDLCSIQSAFLKSFLYCRLQRMSIDSRAASPASPLLHGQSSRLPDSPFTNSGEPSLKGMSGSSAQLDSADSRGLEGRASGGTEAAVLAGKASGGTEAAALAGSASAGIEAAAVAGRGSGGAEAGAQPRRRELRSMSLRPAQESVDSSESSATASALEVRSSRFPCCVECAAHATYLQM